MGWKSEHCSTKSEMQQGNFFVVSEEFLKIDMRITYQLRSCVLYLKCFLLPLRKFSSLESLCPFNSKNVFKPFIFKPFISPRKSSVLDWKGKLDFSKVKKPRKLKQSKILCWFSMHFPHSCPGAGNL